MVNKLFKYKWSTPIIISLVVFLVSILSGALNWINQFAVCGISYFIAGILYKRWLNPFIFFGILILPFVAVYSTLAFSIDAKHTFPIAIVPVISLSAGLLIKVFLTGKIRLIVLVSYFIAVLIAAYVGMPNWLSFVFNKSKNEILLMPDMQFITQDGQHISLSRYKGKVVVLDFWTSSCGICFKKFPEFDKLYSDFEGNENVNCFAVNMYLKRDNLDSLYKMVNELPYSFPHLYTDKLAGEIVRDSLKIIGVPTLLVIGKSGEIVYRGRLYTSRNVLINNVYDIINEELAN